MQALLLRKEMELELTDLPKPAVGADDILVRVRACGICGSDIHGMDGSTGRRIPPVVMGHEAAGVVAEVGANVKGVKEGDRVTFDSTVSCGRCHFCRSGRINLCDNRQVLGVSCGEFRRDGAFAEYVTVPQQIVYPLPGELSFEHAAMIEAVSIGVHAAGITNVKLDDSAVVVGAGMIGLLTIQALRASGCGHIMAVDIDDSKLKMACELGADEGLNPRNCDVPAEVAARTGGRGADIAMEVVGATAPLQTALASVRKGGKLTLIGNLSPTVELPLQSVVTREITVQGSCASNGEYPQCINLLARGAIRVDPLISATPPLSEGAGWFDRLYNKEPGLMKVILKP